MLRIIETFSGIGSQVQALKNRGIEHQVEAIVEWEIGAMYAYDIMHNGPQDLTTYRHHTRDSLLEQLERYTLSANGKEPLTSRALSSLGMAQLKAILCAIERTNNLVDITSVTADKLPEADVLTYSFPCQDLSVSGHWHNNTGGIDRDAKNRSTLLWEIERILKELVEAERKLPKFLMMENVSNILSNKHIENFKEWQRFLEKLGYVNQVYTLNAKNFGIPQSRVRTYMVSVLAPSEEVKQQIADYFFFNDLEMNPPNIPMRSLSEFLRLDYSNDQYRLEAIESTPAYTASRKKIHENNVVLAVGNEVKPNAYARTITTKQDRNPNSGIIEYKDSFLTEINKHYRNLTSREAFLLTGFEEESYSLLMKHNIELSSGNRILPPSKLIRLAGNSIVVQVLEHIFMQIDEINREILIDSEDDAETESDKSLQLVM